MKELLASEWQRMWARKKTWIGFGLFMLYLVFSSVWLNNWKIGFFDADHETHLNALNFAPFLLKEASFFLMLVFAPMMLADSLSGEAASGAYRMVLLRPYRRGHFLLTKWAALAGMMLLFVGSMLAVGLLFGHLVLPGAEQVQFFGSDVWYGAGAALVFTLKFYGLYALILLATLGLCSLIAAVVPSPVLTFVGLVAAYVGMLYVSPSLQFFLLGGETLFKVLSPAGHPGFFAGLAGSLVVSYGLSWLLWNKKDLMC